MQKLEKDFKSHSQLSKVSLRLEKQGLEGREGANDVKVGHHGSAHAQSTNKIAFRF